jgi:hypothetical protein
MKTCQILSLLSAAVVLVALSAAFKWNLNLKDLVDEDFDVSFHLAIVWRSEARFNPFSFSLLDLLTDSLFYSLLLDFETPQRSRL